MLDHEKIARRALEIAEELRRALPPNTDFGGGWQQRYLERQNERYEKALEMARQESADGVATSFVEQHLNREVQPTIRYDLLSEYADKHRLHFNDLCRVVRDACGVSASVPHPLPTPPTGGQQ